jgi:hypothetical protein
MTDESKYWTGHQFGAIAPDGEKVPVMTEGEIRSATAECFGGADIEEMSYDDIVRVLTVAQYVNDLCVKELGDRCKLARMGDSYVIPSALPDSMFVKNVLTEY